MVNMASKIISRCTVSYTALPVKRKKRDLPQSYDKSPYTSRNVKRAK